MKAFIVLVGASIAGGIGWWVGAAVGMWTAFVVSTVATAAGAYATRRLCDEYLP
jgi:hypothetical protein